MANNTCIWNKTKDTGTNPHIISFISDWIISVIKLRQVMGQLLASPMFSSKSKVRPAPCKRFCDNKNREVPVCALY